MCLSRCLTAGRCIALADADGGTDVLAVYDGLPPGLATEDNEASRFASGTDDFSPLGGLRCARRQFRALIQLKEARI
jgi:hypothetical protein